MIMKKMICILLIAWLPLLMVTANAMGLQMTIQNIGDSHQQMTDMPCHDGSDNQQKTQHRCVNCGFCVMTTSIANFDHAPIFELEAFTSISPTFIDVGFKSADQSPAFRPPILN